MTLGTTDTYRMKRYIRYVRPIYVYIGTHTLSHKHTHTLSHKHTHTLSRTLSLTHEHMIRIHTYTYTHTQTHTYTNTHIFSHALSHSHMNI